MLPRYRAWIYDGFDEGVKPFMVPVTNIRFDDFDGIVIQGDEDDNEWIVGTDCRIMQYTGLKDGRGKEICEGDIIMSQDSPGPGIIKWVNTYAGMCLAFTKRGGTAPWDQKNCTIVGNIYENPDMAKSAI